MQWYWKWLLSAEIQLFLLGLTSVLPTLFGTFIFDDGEAILGNEDVVGKSSRTGISNNLTQIFWNDFWGSPIVHQNSHKSYRPLTTLSYRWEYCVWGPNPFPFHLTNWILHGINCILVFHFLRSCYRFSRHRWKSSPTPKSTEDVIFWASVLFSVHPVHVEPLGGLVGRADLISSLIFLTGFILASSLYSSGLKSFIFISLFSTFGSLFKENCFVLVIFYLSFRFCSRPLRLSSREVLYYAVSLSITGVFIIWRLWFQDGPPVFQKFDNPPAFAESWLTKVFSIAYIWVLNVWILINPTWLSFDWSMGCISLIESGLDPRFWLVLTFIIIGLRIAVLAFKSRTFLIGVLIAISTFLPSSNLIFTVGFVIAERNLYLPTIGFSLLVSHAFSRSSKGKWMLIFIASLFYARSIQRSLDWIGPRSLFKSAENVCPNNAKVHYNVGAVYGESGEIELAIRSYTRAIELKSDYYQAMNNLGNILRASEQLDAAEFWLRKAVKTQNDFAAAWMNLGIVLSKKNRTEAMECYMNAMKYRKFYPDCEYNIGNLHLDAKNYSEALKYWIRVTTLQPSHLQSWLNIIILLEQQNRLVEAKEYGHKALNAIGQSDETLQFLMGNIYGRLDEYEVAESYFRNAIERSSDNVTLAKYWSNLGVLYHRWGRLEGARMCYIKALEIQPQLQSARNNLERLLKIRKQS